MLLRSSANAHAMSVGALVLILNGAMVATASPAQLVVGRAYVPYHGFVERIARTGTVDEAAGTVTIAGAGHTIVFTIGSRVALVDDAPTTIAAAPFAVPDDIYVPIAALEPVLDLHVRYVARMHELEVTTPNASPLATPTPYAAPANPLPTPQPATPQPTATPRAQESGPPVARRTPLPQYAPPR